MTEDEHNQNYLENLDYSFVEIFDINDIEDSITMMQNEFVLDYLDIIKLKNANQQHKAIYVLYLINKYTLFIAQLQLIERYEKCAEFRDSLHSLTNSLLVIPKLEYMELLSHNI